MLVLLTRRVLRGHPTSLHAHSRPQRLPCLPLPHLPRRSSASASNRYSTSAVRYRQDKTQRAYNALIAEPEAPAQELKVADLIEDFRKLYVVETYNNGGTRPNIDAQNEYKYAERALYAFLDQNPKKSSVKVENLLDVIPRGSGRVWHAVKEKASTGKITALNGIDEKREAIYLLMRVHGVGPKKAQNWVDAGVRSLQDLLALNPPTAQKLGIKYFNDIEQFIPRAQSDRFKEKLDMALKGADPALEGEIMGSYRRGKPYSSDIDYVVRHKDFDGEDKDVSKALLHKIVEHLRKEKIIVDEPLAFGPQRFFGFAKLPGIKTVRRIDIRLVGNTSYFLYLFAFTGDLELMKYVRTRAATRGLFLNEYGLGKRLTAETRGMQKGADTWDPDHLLPINSEEDIFEALELPYVPPEKRGREDWTKILPKMPY